MQWVSFAACVVAGVPARAQEKPADPTTDIGDVWRAIRHRDAAAAEEAPDNDHRRFLAVAPTIGSKPTTGFTGGLNGNMAFFHGDPQTTRISSLTGGFRVSQKRQVLSGFRLSMFTADDRWYLQSENRLQWTSLNTYGLGAAPLPTGEENVKFNAVKFYETAYRNVAPGLFVGAGLNVSAHSNIRPGDGLLPEWDQTAKRRAARWLACSTTRATTPSTRSAAGSPAPHTARSTKGFWGGTRRGRSCRSTCARTERSPRTAGTGWPSGG